MIRFNDPSSAGFGVSPAAALPQPPVAQLHSRLKAKGARMPKNLDEEARECRRHRKQQLKPLSSNFSGAGNFWRAAMTRQLFCRAGQRAIFGDQLIMRRKPADDLVSGGLFGPTSSI
jgi:hypothetical protein